jgi:hypothetical protein
MFAQEKLLSPIPTLAAYIHAFGSPNQIERIAANITLPDAEVDAIVRSAFWEVFDGYYKRKRLLDSEVRKLAVMHRMAEPSDEVTFEVIEPADELTSQQWEALKQIQELAKSFGAKVTPFWVIAHCGRKHWKNSYVHVDFQVEERDYRVDVCLELPKA